MNPYKKKLDLVLSGLKPMVRQKMNSVGQQIFCFALALAAEWGAGDAVAGKILDDWGLKAIGKTSAMAEIFDITVSSGGFVTPKEWWLNNFPSIADGLLVESVATKLKSTAQSRREV